MIPESWHLLPCFSISSHSKRCSCRRGCSSPGKHPKTKNGLLDATNDWSIIRGWIHEDPFLNLAVRTGRESGIWVLDVDYKHWHETLQELPVTLVSETPRGFHYYWKWPKEPYRKYQDIRNRQKVFENVDVRGSNGYVILPNNHNGYRWANDLPIVDAPNWLLEQALSQ